MTKYRLSRNVTITGVDSYLDTPSQYSTGHYILCDDAREKDFLINETINYFIGKFSQSKTLNQVLQEIKSEIQSSDKEVEETCSAFFTFLRKRNILVRDNIEEEPLLSIQPLYTEGDSIKDLNILKVLSNKHSVDIYTVFDRISRNTYVIKLLNRNKTGEGAAYQKELSLLEREYAFLKNAMHLPGICKVFSFNHDEAQNAYIVMEYIQGKSFEIFFKETEALTKEDCFRVMENMLHAFSQLHQNNLIHGDIHSSNVLVSEDKTVKIIDLGYSRNAITEKNEVLKHGGVHFYMPPERIKKNTSLKKYIKPPDLYSDVYQIGVLLYLALYRALPFDGFIWKELAPKIKEGKIIYPEIFFTNDPVPKTLVNVIKKCLNKNPRKRYPDATAIVADFSMDW